jgi:hypothetical protein
MAGDLPLQILNDDTLRLPPVMSGLIKKALEQEKSKITDRNVR